jgi:hypothetical protein
MDISNSAFGHFKTLKKNNQIYLKYDNLQNLHISNNKYITINTTGKYHLIILQNYSSTIININHNINYKLNKINTFNLDKNDILSFVNPQKKTINFILCMI